MKNYQLPWQELAAYHEAGHAVMALEQQIMIHQLRLPDEINLRHASRFAGLGELCDLASPNLRENRLAVCRYVRFLLAGPAAVLIRTELHHEVGREFTGRARFQNNWLQSRIFHGDADLDLATSLIFAWLSPQCEDDLDRVFHQYWKQAIAAFEFKALWGQVVSIAQGIRSNNFTIPEKLKLTYGF